MIGAPNINAIIRAPTKYFESCVKIKYKMGILIIIMRPTIIKIVPPINCHLHATNRKMSNIIVGLKTIRKSPSFRGPSPKKYKKVDIKEAIIIPIIQIIVGRKGKEPVDFFISFNIRFAFFLLIVLYSLVIITVCVFADIFNVNLRIAHKDCAKRHSGVYF